MIFQIVIFGQSDEYSFCLIDKSTNAPIVGAHYFINNSTIAGTSNENGYCQLNIPSSIDGEVLITHIAYNSLKVKDKSILQNLDTIALNPSLIGIHEVTITAKRGKTWKQNYKKFIKAFLGQNEAAKSCKILNPEVLRFHNDAIGLRASAIDFLKIENKYLGYHIKFILSHFDLEKDGSSSYKGYAQFSEFEKVSKKQAKRRVAIYKKSLDKFFVDLISKDLRDYKLSNLKYVKKDFELIKDFKYSSDVKIDSLTGHYLLSFDEFLGVDHLNLKLIKTNEVGMARGGLEAQTFTGSSMQKGSRVISPKSYLYKKGTYLIIDKQGTLLNKGEMKEYGLWAELKLAATLPVDYLSAPIEKVNQSLSMLRILAIGDPNNIDEAFAYFDKDWKAEFTIPLLEVLILTASDKVEKRILDLLQNKHGKSAIPNYYDGIRWAWLNDIPTPDYFLNFKAELYKSIDPKFETYFKNRLNQAIIPFNEILWGGVKQDGIPPLRNPKMVTADNATYLGEDDIVFGLVVNGIPKAYPKRILAWHEFFVDEFDGEMIAGVYCTLCGTVVAYNMTHNGVLYDLGTSGFLYQSNKLMYDKATQSLWSTLGGNPVIGPLVNQGIELDMYPVSTTKWGKWKAQYPNTLVLDIDTGFKRNYSEGEAYRDYYANDKLMFPVKVLDSDLKNKDEVLAIRFSDGQATQVSLKELSKQKVFISKDLDFIVITLDDSSYKVYEWTEDEMPKLVDQELQLASGKTYQIQEEQLINGGEVRKRIVSHRSFWFAWNNYKQSIEH